jgi:hypothetical protein
MRKYAQARIDEIKITLLIRSEGAEKDKYAPDTNKDVPA